MRSSDKRSGNYVSIIEKLRNLDISIFNSNPEEDDLFERTRFIETQAQTINYTLNVVVNKVDH